MYAQTWLWNFGTCTSQQSRIQSNCLLPMLKKLVHLSTLFPLYWWEILHNFRVWCAVSLCVMLDPQWLSLDSYRLQEALILWMVLTKILSSLLCLISYFIGCIQDMNQGHRGQGYHIYMSFRVISCNLYCAF